MDCLFCNIVSGKEPSHKVWEGGGHIAVLTPFPNTEGMTVVILKKHLPSNILQLEYNEVDGIMLASKIVARLLRKKLKVERVGLVCEGYGIDHAHVKLIPMHGIPAGEWKAINSSPKDQKFYETYPGFIASHDGPRMSEEKLTELQQKILS